MSNKASPHSTHMKVYVSHKGKSSTSMLIIQPVMALGPDKNFSQESS